MRRYLEQLSMADTAPPKSVFFLHFFQSESFRRATSAPKSATDLICKKSVLWRIIVTNVTTAVCMTNSEVSGFSANTEMQYTIWCCPVPHPRGGGVNRAIYFLPNFFKNILKAPKTLSCKEKQQVTIIWSPLPENISWLRPLCYFIDIAEIKSLCNNEFTMENLSFRLTFHPVVQGAVAMVVGQEMRQVKCFETQCHLRMFPGRILCWSRFRKSARS